MLSCLLGLRSCCLPVGPRASAAGTSNGLVGFGGRGFEVDGGDFLAGQRRTKNRHPALSGVLVAPKQRSVGVMGKPPRDARGGGR